MSFVAFEGSRLSGFRLNWPVGQVRHLLQEARVRVPEIWAGLRREPTLLHLRRSMPARPVAGLLAAGLILGGLAWLAPAPEAPAVPVPAPPPNPWVEIAKPMPLYQLAGSEFGREAVYEARRHRTSGGRIDTMSFGAPDFEKRSYLRLSLYRPGGEDFERSTFFVDMARHAASAHLSVARSAAPDALTTRFGDFEAADVTLSGAAGETPCLGFRLLADKPDFSITGVACGTRERPMDRAILNCTLDRLDLLAAGDDRPLAAFFAAAEPGRGKGCQQSRLAFNMQPNWLDPAGKTPALRSTVQPAPAAKAKR